MDNTSRAESADTTDNTKFDSTKGIVVLLDLLGTKEIYKNSAHIGKINKKYNELLSGVLSTQKERSYILQTKDVEVRINPIVRFFSDTILIIITESEVMQKYDDLSEHSPLNSILVSYCGTIRDLFLKFMQEGLFLRGVVSYGDIWVGENLIIGPAIDEAQEWYERGDWIGIFLTPCALYEYEKFLHKDFKIDIMRNLKGKYNEANEKAFNTFRNNSLKHTITYPVPLNLPLARDYFFSTRAINWPIILINNKFRNEKTIWEVFSQRPIFPSFYSKYKNTLDFYEHALKESKENKKIK